MNRSVSLAAIAIIAVLATAFSPVTTGAQDQVAKKEKTPLQLAMRKVMGLTKKLRGSLGDPAFQAVALSQLAELEITLVEAKSGTPRRAGGLEGDDLQQFMTGFRQQLIAMLTATLELEGMVLDGVPAEKLQEKLSSLHQIKKAGHKGFK